MLCSAPQQGVTGCAPNRCAHMHPPPTGLHMPFPTCAHIHSLCSLTHSSTHTLDASSSPSVATTQNLSRCCQKCPGKGGSRHPSRHPARPTASPPSAPHHPHTASRPGRPAWQHCPPASPLCQAQRLLSLQPCCRRLASLAYPEGKGEVTALFPVGAWLIQEASVDLIFC